MKKLKLSAVSNFDFDTAELHADKTANAREVKRHESQTTD